MLSDSQRYVPQKSRRLPMLLEEIYRLVDMPVWTAREIIQTFEKAVYFPIGYAIKVSKSNNESPLIAWEYDCPAALDVLWKSIQEDIRDIVTYT